MMADTLDSLETRPPAQRERDLMERLPLLVAQAQSAPGWQRILSGVDASAVNSRAALARLPVTRKSDLKALQSEQRPFGGLNSTPAHRLGRIFMSPGPIFDPEGRCADWWRFARPMYAAGVRSGSLVQNCFSYHFTPAAFMVEGGAARIGCTVIPAGAGQTEMQVQAINDLKPAAYVGTPSFLKIILEKADELKADATSLTKALVSGEALPPSLRQALNARGITVRQCYATADLGMIAYESEAQQGLTLDEDVLMEIVRPGTGDPVADGEVGEVLITTFNLDYPLLRFATGDLSAVLPGISPCGRTNVRIKGWLGRADQTTKVKGMFVHPHQVAAVVKRHPEIGKARLVVDNALGQDRMVLHCESGRGDDVLGDAVVASIRDVTKLRGEVRFVSPGDLPNDGKVIEDIRTYE